MIKKKLLQIFILTFFLFNILSFKVSANDSDPIAKADFRMDFIIEEETGKAVYVNDSVLPMFAGKNFPYKLYCTNLSRGDSTYEWFVKYPGNEYIMVDTIENPVLTINQYGKVFVKLCINGDDSLSQNYFISTKDYSIKKENQIISSKEFNSQSSNNGMKTILTEWATVISDQPFNAEPKKNSDIPIDLNNIKGNDFRITYIEGNKQYDVSNGPVPTEIKTLPYFVKLTNTGEQRNLVWYIKFPKTDYIWMDSTQNTAAQIWHYGTTRFRLVVDGDFANAVEYTVTAYGSGQKSELKESVENFNKSKSALKAKADFSLKCLNTSDNTLTDVTNSSLRDDSFVFPHKIFPVNLSKGDITSEWFIKSPSSNSYQPVSNFPIIINEYGPTYIKLRLNENDKLSIEKKVVSYYTNK